MVPPGIKLFPTRAVARRTCDSTHEEDVPEATPVFPSPFIIFANYEM